MLWSPVLVHSLFQINVRRTYQNWAKSWWLIDLAASLRIHYHHCAMSISPRKWLVQKYLSPLKGFPQRPLQPHSIAYVCTTKLRCGWAWQMTWTLQIGDGRRKAVSWFQSWRRRTLLLTNFSKLFILTVLLDAAADVMDFFCSAVW